MLKGYDENGVLQNVKVSEDGRVSVEGQASVTGNVSINNTNANPIPTTGNITINNNTSSPVPIIEVENEVEVVLNASILTLSTTAQTISVGKKVTEISIANYSETADVTMTIGLKTYTIGSSVATDLPINANVASIDLISTEADTKVQIIIKGVE